MTIYSNADIGSPSAPSVWICALLGIVMIAAGAFALADVMFATIVSIKLIGLAAVVAGAFEVIHGFWTRGWGGLLWQILLGLLYAAFGLVLIVMPRVGALIVTYILGALLLASGIFRTALGVAHWRESGWMMLLSGIFGLLAGLLILLDFPASSLWILGLLVGFDLIAHGLGWLLFAFQPVAGMTPRSA